MLCFGADTELSLVHIGGVFAKSTCASQSKPPSLRFATTRELGGLGLASQDQLGFGFVVGVQVRREVSYPLNCTFLSD